MSSSLAAGQTLELLANLKRTVEELAARAQQLNGGFQAAAGKERRRCDAALEEQAKQLSAALAQAQADYQAALAQAKARADRRKSRIGEAYQASKEQRLKQVDERVGGRRYELQKKVLQAEKDRDAALTAAAQRYEEFTQALASAQGDLAQLEGEAQQAFKGHRALIRLFFNSYKHAETDPTLDEHRLLADSASASAKARAELGRFRRYFLLRIFRYWALWAALALCEFALVPGLANLDAHKLTWPQAAGAVAGSLVLIFGIRWLAVRQAWSTADALSAALASARRLHDAAAQNGQAHYQQELQRLRDQFTAATREADQQLKQAHAEAGDQRVACRMRSDERTVRAGARSERLNAMKLDRLRRENTNALQQMNQTAEVRIQALKSASDEVIAKLTAEHRVAHQALEAEWNTRIQPIYQAFDSARSLADGLFPPWTAPVWQHWSPPTKFAQAARFGALQADVALLCDALPNDEALALPGPAKLNLPLCLAYPAQGSILIETGTTGHGQAIDALNNVILRLLSASPPGRLNFTILDPVGLGQNFAGVMHLADYEEQIIHSRIWTQSIQFEERLGELNEHMEKVIQMYLRNEYQTIAEYNEQAGVIAEKYHFLVVADFPANFTETAARRLASIAASGARCGVYMLLHWDQRLALPEGFIPDELRKSTICLHSQGSEFVVRGRTLPGTTLLLDSPPPPDAATDFIHQVGRLSRDSSRVQVPFEHVAPAESDLWTETTTAELRVPIGRTGATKLQYLAIGKGTRQHGLVAGKTGSGKSTLFHVIITNLSLWCSPEEVEFYLVDFKKGVEFKCYAAARLPHARVVAIESDREFGLSVLQRVDDELKRRGDLFRALSVQDVAGYKRAGGTAPIPRTLLLIDEFQEFFVEDDRIAQTASLLLDRIVRQGRAFGIHVLLGSQTLGGAYTVARTTLGQMVIRVALQCNEADAYLIMDDTNPAPRLLSRPGEAIYNDMAGALEGNSPFQVVWLPDTVRDSYLQKVRQRADHHGETFPGPLVFEGNAPADLSENVLLRRLLESAALQPAAAGRIWLGAPNSIKGPTEVVFRRQSGNNLLVVGQRDEAILTMLSVGLVSLAAQYPIGGARFILCDATPPGTPQRRQLEAVAAAMAHTLTLVKPGDVPALMAELAAEKKRREEEVDPEAAPPVFLFIHGLQRFSRLRYEEDFGFSSSDPDTAAHPAVVLNDLICEGPRLGFHVIAVCDTYNNVSRFLSRKGLSEFEMRVLFQMSANDSASLIDNPKAGLLGLHRALFFNAQEGYLETFRPYAMPSPAWLEAAAQNLTRLLGPLQSG